MAFWTQGSAVAKPASRPSAGPARPLSYVLSTGAGSVLEYATLVRLRVDVPTAAAAFAAAAEDVDDETAAAEVAQNAVCAIGQLHEVIRGIEDKAENARVSAVLEVMQDRTLQLLCSKTVVAKVYKSLLPHQASVGFTMAPAKACLSQKPVAAWDLEESLQTAVIKTLTGCSSGTPSCINSTTPGTTKQQAAASGQLHSWMCLSRRKLAGMNLLTAVPGEVSTAAFVDLEVKHDAGNKGLLLIVHAAGSVKFRLFSPCQALQQDANSLKPPLTLDDSDTDLLSDPTKLAAAARQLEGRAVKLLPDERLVFIKGLTAAPTDPQQLQRITQHWLGCYGLLLPPSFPFLVGVATHPEAEAAQMQVPSCCVLTNLGLSTLPGSHPGGSCHAAAVSRLVSDLQAAAVGYSFWGNKLTVQLKDSSHAGTGLSQANLQLTQASQPAAGTPAAAHLKAYNLQNEWTSASELSKLQAQASKQPRQHQQQQQQRELTAAEVQLMGLVEADGVLDVAGASQQAGGSRQQGQRGAGSNSSAHRERWAGLRAYLAERKKQEDAQKVAISGVGGIAAPAAGRGLFPSARMLGGSKPASGSGAGASAVRAAAAPAAGGAPAAPRFGSRKPGTSKPPAAAAAKPRGVKKPGLVGSRVIAGLQAAQVEAETAAADASDPAAAAAAGGGGGGADTGTAAAAKPTVPAVAAKPAAPSFGKRPGAADAAGKPPAAKKVKTAAAGAEAGGTAAKPKASKKPKAAASTGAAGATANPAAGAEVAAAAAAGAGGAAATAAGEGTGSQQPAAEQQQEKKKRTKAADLDLAAVTTKVQAAYAAAGGAALKGVSVPEMQCYLRARGVKGGSAKRADVEARLLGLLAGKSAAS